LCNHHLLLAKKGPWCLFRRPGRRPGTARVYLLFMVGKAAGGCSGVPPWKPGTAGRSRRPSFPGHPLREPVELMAYKGDVMVLHFWATWCLPCQKEFPTSRTTRAPGGCPLGFRSTPYLWTTRRRSPAVLGRRAQQPIIFMDQSGWRSNFRSRASRLRSWWTRRARRLALVGHRGLVRARRTQGDRGTAK